MSALVLPQSSRVLIVVSVAAQSVALYEVGSRANGRLWLALLAFFISGYVADAFTRVAHFGFVYEKGRRLVPRRL